MSRLIFAPCIVFFAIVAAGCATTEPKPSEVLSFNGKSGVIRVEASRFRGLDRATSEAHGYCLSLKDGYGVDTINFAGDSKYLFSCVIKTADAIKYSSQRQTATQSIPNTPDGSKDRCSQFGFISGTTDHANCVLQMQLAEKRSVEEQQRYAEEKAAYDSRQAAAAKEAERRKGLALLEFGSRLLGGQNPVDAVNSVGTGAPIAPRPPAPIFHNITLPNGNLVTCTTNGAFTNCN